MKNKTEQNAEAPSKTTGKSTWSVWRQDDNGNIALVKSGLTEEEALRRVAEYEAKGHKQTYWTKESQ